MNQEQLRITGFEDKIQQLIFRAEAFLYWSKEFYDLYDVKYKKLKTMQKKQGFIKKRTVKYLVLHNVLYFFEVVSILNTLFKQKNRKDNELSFENYFAKTASNAFEQEIERIRIMYNKSGIGQIRNKIIAHKDKRNIGDPLSHYMDRVNKKVINEAEKIIKKLLTITSKNFKDPIGNNYIKEFFKDAHKFAIEAIDKEV